MIMCVLLCYPVSIRIYYQQGGLFLVLFIFVSFTRVELELNSHLTSEHRSTEITVDYSSSVHSHWEHRVQCLGCRVVGYASSVYTQLLGKLALISILRTQPLGTIDRYPC